MVEHLKNSQKFRFLLVGAGATTLDFCLLFMFRALGLNTILANYPATTIAMFVSFFANRKYTFKAHGEALKRQMVLFFAVTLFALWVIQPLVIYITEPIIIAETNYDNIAALIAKLAATAASMLWNYMLYSRLVFKTKRQI